MARFTDLGFACVDVDRARRRGYPEAIFCEGKTTDEILAIATSLVATGAPNIFATRAAPAAIEALAKGFPEAQVHSAARLVVLNPTDGPRIGNVVVVSHRPVDAPVADEVTAVASTMGSAVTCWERVPLDEPSALPAWARRLDSAHVVVVVDGSGSGLASVIAGLVRCVTIAVPTSRTSLAAGMSALLSALNSCVPGVLAVNVDNGFGAGYAAHVLNARMREDERETPPRGTGQ
jgi:hypothetical protein